MRQNSSRGRGRESRNNSQRRSNGRKPKLDSSRRPKPRRSKVTSSERRAAANSVFASSNAVQKKGAETQDAENRGRRLQQVLAAAGYGSRRRCEELITKGRVEIDGQIVTELGVRVVPGEQKIRVDGEALKKARPTYVALNKPKNALCTNSDPQGRRRAIDFIPAQLGRLFPVGRLDQNSEGLILLTNDGALAERLTHPRFQVAKKYRVQVAGLVDYELVDALKRGVHIAEGVVQADEVIIKSRHKLSSILEITLKEGKNREIRRMLARVGHKVMQLQRVQVGSIKLGKLAPGDYRRLTSQEVAELYRIADVKPDADALNVDQLPETLRRKPIELAAIQEREERKALERENARKTKSEKKAERDKSKRDPYFQAEVKAQFKRRYEGETLETERVEEPEIVEKPKRRREPKPEFREEFRAESRSAERRRARREYDDEERTIGPKKFERDENNPGRDRFNYDASIRRERARGAKWSKTGGKGSAARSRGRK